MTKEEWLALAKRCEQATGPDQKIDAAIAKALGLVPAGFTPGTDRGYESLSSSKHGWIWDAQQYTASLDALIERELPGFDWYASANLGKGCGAVIGDADNWQWIRPATPALALRAAFCRVMAERSA